MLDTVIQREWMMGRILKRSPLVQSGVMSQLANMIAGETRIVRNARTILRPATSVSIIVLIAAFWLCAETRFSPHQSKLFSVCKSVHAYVCPHHILIYPPQSMDTQKNPPTATRVSNIDVNNFLNIDWLDHNCYFFANIYSIHFDDFASSSVWMSPIFFRRSAPESGMTTTDRFMRASRLLMRVSRTILFCHWRMP